MNTIHKGVVLAFELLGAASIPEPKAWRAPEAKRDALLTWSVVLEDLTPEEVGQAARDYLAAPPMGASVWWPTPGHLRELARERRQPMTGDEAFALVVEATQRHGVEALQVGDRSPTAWRLGRGSAERWAFAALDALGGWPWVRQQVQRKRDARPYRAPFLEHFARTAESQIHARAARTLGWSPEDGWTERVSAMAVKAWSVLGARLVDFSDGACAPLAPSDPDPASLHPDPELDRLLWHAVKASGGLRVFAYVDQAGPSRGALAASFRRTWQTLQRRAVVGDMRPKAAVLSIGRPTLAQLVDLSAPRVMS